VHDEELDLSEYSSLLYLADFVVVAYVSENISSVVSELEAV